MPDYGRPVEFGVSLIPEAAELPRIRELAHAADAAGLDLVGIQDHPYQRRFLDTWLLIAALAATTERVRLFPDVANLPLRPAPMMAKAAASLDVLSGGRFELGLGAGGFLDAVAGMGGPRQTPGQSVDALEEAIAVLRAIWSADGPVSFEGRHSHLAGYKPGPPPAHRIGIWLGARGPRMLRITGALADGWIPSRGWLPPEELPGYHERIDTAARDAGRDPAEVRRLYNISGAITSGRRGADRLEGPVEQWVDTLAGWAVESGIDTFVLWPAEPTVAQIELFAHEVAPAVREAVAARRGGSDE